LEIIIDLPFGFPINNIISKNYSRKLFMKFLLLFGLLLLMSKVKRKLVVGTGFWTSILSPVFGAGLSQITRFWTNRIPAAVPV